MKYGIHLYSWYFDNHVSCVLHYKGQRLHNYQHIGDLWPIQRTVTSNIAIKITNMEYKCIQCFTNIKMRHHGSNIIWYHKIVLSVTMVLPPHSHILIDIKLFLSVNVFKYTPLGVSISKNKILPKLEVKWVTKSENWSFDFRYSFQTWLMGTNHTSGRFWLQKGS